jgi:hypothetical protein
VAEKFEPADWDTEGTPMAEAAVLGVNSVHADTARLDALALCGETVTEANQTFAVH